MKRRYCFRTAVIVALLLPGLALAAPIAGACALCGDGDDCHMQQSAQPAPETQSCCDTTSEAPPERSLGSSHCDCDRETPPAVVADPAPTVKTGTADVPRAKLVAPVSPTRAATGHPTSAPAPPPAPPAYLIDCAFLT